MILRKELKTAMCLQERNRRGNQMKMVKIMGARNSSKMVSPKNKASYN